MKTFSRGPCRERQPTKRHVTGPIFAGKKPALWLGQPGEIPVAIPDAFFKIVIKTGATPARPDVLAFIYPNISISRKATDHASYLTSVDAIEAKTGLDFLRKLPAADQAVVESGKRRRFGSSELLKPTPFPAPFPA